jgi:hypothetical protein
MKIRPVGTEVFHADGRTDGRTLMTKLTVAFRNFADKSKNTLHTFQEENRLKYFNEVVYSKHETKTHDVRAERERFKCKASGINPYHYALKC